MVNVNGRRPQYGQGAGTASGAANSKRSGPPLHAGQPAGPTVFSTRVRRVSRPIGPSHGRMYHDGPGLPATAATGEGGRLAGSHFSNRARGTGTHRHSKALLDLG